MKLDTIRVMPGVNARRLGTSPDGSRVTGVAAVGTGGPCFLEADLVVDAAGRGSRAARWLEEIGYAAPKVDRISLPVTYATRCFRRLPDDLAGDTFEMVGSDQPCHRGGLMIAVEGERWIVTLSGYGDQVPPQDLGGFIAYARSLPAPRMGDLVARAEPLDAGCTFHFPGSLRRRWESLASMPSGFLVIGDGICSFNPVFGQGMTVAAQESQALSAALAGPSAGLAQRFFGAAARIVDRPWNIAAGTDLQHPDAAGHRNLLTGVVAGYMNRLSRAAQRDAVVATRLYQALNLLIPSAGLFGPDIIVRTLRHKSGQPSDRARSGATLPALQPEVTAGRMGLKAWFRIRPFWVTQGVRKRPAFEGRISAGRYPVREAASLPRSSPLGLKRSQAEQGQPVQMALAGHQLPRALALALGASAAQEAAMVQEEPQQVQIRPVEVAARGEVAAQP